MYRLPLPPRQAAVLEFVQNHIAEKGYPPTVREISAAFGFTSTNAAFGHLKALAVKGYVRRDPLRSRAIAVIAS